MPEFASVPVRVRMVAWIYITLYREHEISGIMVRIGHVLRLPFCLPLNDELSQKLIGNGFS